MASTLLTYPRLISVSDPSGSSLTRATVTPLTPDLIEGMDYIEYSMEQIFSRMMESRAVGVVPNSLYDLLTSRIVPIGKGEMHKKTVGQDSIIAPFKYRRRKRNAETSYFAIASGSVNPDAGGPDAGGITIPESGWDIVVNVGPGQFATQFQDIERYFLTGSYINVEHVNTGTGAGLTTTHKIIKAVNTTSTTATITVAAPLTDTGWLALTAPQQSAFQPEHGVITLLTNNVSDYESQALNEPFNNNTELMVDWFQTSRYARITNKEYEEMLARILRGEVNQFAKNFKHIGVVERNRAMQHEHDKKWMQSLWFNGRISEHQIDDLAANDFTKLEQVVDPDDPNSVYEYKANALGYRTLLGENGRIVDLQGGQLNLDTLFELLYNVRRNRKLDGKAHEIIDLACDRFSKDIMDRLLIAYLKDYGYSIETKVEKGKVDSLHGPVFEYTVYDIPSQGFRVALFTHDFFDDRLSAFGDGTGGLQGSVDIRNRGRVIQVIDWDDIEIALLDANSAKREYKNDITAQANETFAKVIKLNTKTYDLRSKTWSLMVGDYNRHLIIENFNDSQPILTTRSASLATTS